MYNYSTYTPECKLKVRNEKRKGGGKEKGIREKVRGREGVREKKKESEKVGEREQ